MARIKAGLATLAAFGLTVSPAIAQTRAAQALPAASAQLDPAAVSRASSPSAAVSELGRGGGLSPAVLLAFIALLGLLLAAAGGGGGNGSDSPG